MAMLEIKTVLLVITLALVSLAIGYFIYLTTRPKKLTWRAKVYQLGDGISEVVRNEKGEIISTLQLRQLIPYAKDILERTEKDGQTIFKLVHLNKVTGEVTNNVVDVWAKDYKEVHVLIDQENCVILKKGWDVVTGTAIFRPMTFSRINLIKNEIVLRKQRLDQEKNAWENIIKFGMIILLVLGMVAISYITINGYVKISSMQTSASSMNVQILKNITMDIRKMEDILLASQMVKPEQHPVGMVNQT